MPRERKQVKTQMHADNTSPLHPMPCALPVAARPIRQPCQCPYPTSRWAAAKHNENCRICRLYCVAALFLLAIAAATGAGSAASAGSTTTADPSDWKGHKWKLTNGGMAGVAKGNPANIFVDQNGYLHLRIVNRGGTYTASEMFSTEKMGFGTYQWQIEGALLNMDKSTVLGLFSYGPTGGIGVDAENEIDIEFSQWNNTCNGCNADFTFYPATGNKSLGPMEDNFKIGMGGSTLTTARFEWSSTRIVGTIMRGLQPPPE